MCVCGVFLSPPQVDCSLLEGKPQSCGRLCVEYVVGTLLVLEKVACHRLSVFVSM